MLDSCSSDHVRDDVDGWDEWNLRSVGRLTLTQTDIRYYERRAEEEIARALGSDDPRVSRAHYLLAGMYLDRVHSSREG
jgi:hypothetical protein